MYGTEDLQDNLRIVEWSGKQVNNNIWTKPIKEKDIHKTIMEIKLQNIHYGPYNDNNKFFKNRGDMGGCTYTARIRNTP